MAVPQNLPVDPDVKLPGAVRRASAQIAEHYSQPVTPAPQDAPPKEQIPPPAPTQPQQPPEPPPQPLAPPVPPEQTSQGAPAGPPDWESRYNSMKGRYDRAATQLQSLGDTVRKLSDEVERLRLQPPMHPIPAEQQAPRLLTAQEIELYGEDLLNVVGKKAKEDLTPEITQLKQQIEDLKARTQARDVDVQRSARSVLFSTLDDRLPEWRDLNNRKDFVAWLALPDKYSGDIRHKLLDRAVEQNDTPRVLAFFQGFLSEEAALAPAPAVEAAPNGQSHKVPLDAFAAPGRAKTSAASAPVEKPVFTRASISQFYTDVAAGRYRGRDEERQRIDLAIHEAGREGRVH